MTYKIEEYIQSKIYIVEYPIRFAGMDLFSRMTIVKLGDSKLWVHNHSARAKHSLIMSIEHKPALVM